MHHPKTVSIAMLLTALAFTASMAFTTSETLAQQSQPALQTRATIRFVTDSDFPPFNFLDEEGTLAGFHVDLARAICLEASATCQVNARPWAETLPALQRGEADAAIAGHAINAASLRFVDFSDRYLPMPARFAALKTTKLEATPTGLDGRSIAVTKDTAHEAYARAFFRDSRIQVFASSDLARDAVSAGKVDVVFDDGISLLFWTTGTVSRECCELRGGAYIEPRYFGEGMAIALTRSDPDLKRVVNDALKSIRESGRMEELLQRYFPQRLH